MGKAGIAVVWKGMHKDGSSSSGIRTYQRVKFASRCEHSFRVSLLLDHLRGSKSRLIACGWLLSSCGSACGQSYQVAKLFRLFLVRKRFRRELHAVVVCSAVGANPWFAGPGG